MARRSLGSITKRDNGSWLVRVTLPSDDGKQRRKTKTVRGSKRDAEKVLQELLAKAGHVDGGMTFSDFLDLHYVPWHDAEYDRPDSMLGFHRNVERMRKRFGGMRLEGLTRPMMETWGSTAKEYEVNAMKAALNKAVDWEMIERNPLSSVKPHRARAKRERFTIDEAVRVVNAFAGSDMEPLVLLMLMCGMRREEALGMDWSRIDFKTGKACIDRSWHYRKGKGWFEDTKNPSSRRVVTIDPLTLERLSIIRKAGGIVRMGAMVETRPGVRMPPSTAADKWTAVVKPLLGDRYLPMKNLRHTHASICLDNGVPMEAIAKRLGHSSTKLTESTYADSTTIQEKCADAMVAAFGA